MFKLSKNRTSTQIFASTHIGDRTENQDSYTSVISNGVECYLVADGMGGHKGGKLASTEFCQSVVKIFPSYSKTFTHEPELTINSIFIDARQDMCKSITKINSSLSPHTTAVVAFSQESVVYIAHIGDSRAYLIQSNNISWQSRDHSVAQLMVQNGDLDASEVSQDESQNVLYRSIDCNKSHQPSIKKHSTRTGDSLVLCSDGFWCYISEPEIVTLTQAQDTQKKLEELTQKAFRRANGNADNITVLIIRF